MVQLFFLVLSFCCLLTAHAHLTDFNIATRLQKEITNWSTSWHIYSYIYSWLSERILNFYCCLLLQLRSFDCCLFNKRWYVFYVFYVFLVFTIIFYLVPEPCSASNIKNWNRDSGFWTKFQNVIIVSLGLPVATLFFHLSDIGLLICVKK